MKGHRSTIAASSALVAVLCWTDVAWADQKLIDAAKRGKLAEVQALIAGGVDLDAGDGKGNTALMESARTGKADVVRALIAAGAALDVQSRDGWTAAITSWPGAPIRLRSGQPAASSGPGASRCSTR